MVRVYSIINIRGYHMGSAQQSQLKMGEGQFGVKEMVGRRKVLDPAALYEFHEMLGEGTYAKVFKARGVASGEFRVVKKVEKAKCPTLGRHLTNEYSILKQMDHPNIIKMYEMFQDDAYYYIVTEYLGGIDLLELLQSSKHLQEELIFDLFYQAFLAVSYLHKSKVMHRDIKLENMVYDPQSRWLKLIDFGSALKFQQLVPRERRCTGTIPYIAPEVINKYYSASCDVWSLGVVLYVLLCGSAPFQGQDQNETMQKILKESLKFDRPIWQSRSTQVQRLLEKMLEKNFERRINLCDIMKDPWVVANKKKRETQQSEKQMICSCLENMIRFKKLKLSDIQLGVLLYMTNFTVPPTGELSLRKAFHAIDQLADGKIDEKELKLALIQYLGMASKQAELSAREIMESIDFDQSKEINYSEFIIIACDLRIQLTLPNLAHTFHFIDSDGSGRLSTRELRARLGEHLDEEHYALIMKKFNRDRNGQISHEEFIRMMSQILSQY